MSGRLPGGMDPASPEAAAFQAARIALWTPPLDWPHNWLAVYAGTIAPVEAEQEQPVETVRRKAGRK